MGDYHNKCIDKEAKTPNQLWQESSDYSFISPPERIQILPKLMATKESVNTGGSVRFDNLTYADDNLKTLHSLYGSEVLTKIRTV